MSDSPNFDRTPNSTTAKLLEVDSQLAVQEAELLSQLESVQEKRRSLKTVLNLFTTADTPATASCEEPVRTPPAQIDRELEPVSSDLAAQALETSRETATTQSPTTASPDTQSNPAKKTVPSSIKRNKTTKLTHPTKAGKKASGWQNYVREEFSNSSLAQAVSLVLQRQAEQVFEIPAIMKAIFVDELPKEVGSQARRQVTNILSQGAMKNKWYRGQLGQYSMSRTAAKAKLA